MSEQHSTTPATAHPYDALVPDVILDAVEALDLPCTGAFLALNSYENRVYRVDIEDRPPVAVKFYRPGRWSDAAIEEEHAFSIELAEHEVPVVPPLLLQGRSLQCHAGFRYAVYPWAPGRQPEFRNDDERQLMGRYLGRLHLIGRSRPFEQRPRLDVQTFGWQALALLENGELIPDYLRASYHSIAHSLVQRVEQAFETAGDVARLRLHGDCHLGNILWTDTGPLIVDLDDCRSGPAVQDLWMLLSGEREDMELQLSALLDGYIQFDDFDPTELMLIEPLRALRMIHYSAWLASRWDDPAFPRAFPWFNSAKYWEEQVLALREQLALLDEPPLRWR